MDTSLVINSTDTAGKRLQKSITNINPAKSNTLLNEFAHKVNALTTNNYVATTRINKQDVTEPDSGLTINVDDSNYTGEVSQSTIDGGLRLTFGEDNFIDVTYTIE